MDEMTTRDRLARLTDQDRQAEIAQAARHVAEAEAELARRVERLMHLLKETACVEEEWT